MKHGFQVNGNPYYYVNPQVEQNSFIGLTPDETTPLPRYADIKDRLPQPIFDGNEAAVDCYYKTWEIAFGNLKKADPKAGFVSDFIDTAFNGDLFMWDSSFITMFGKYASKIFDFQKTLDNFYAHQHKDGFISRQLFENEWGERFSRDDPVSTGPNILPWAEWEYYRSTFDVERLSRVFVPLCAYHRWLMLNRSWPDGSYWSCGLACGMDNSPRPAKEYHPYVSHGFMSWIDACAQQYMSAEILLKMAKILGKENEVSWLKEEMSLLYKTINHTMWSETDHFYYDKYRDGTLSNVKTVASYWTLLAGLVPKERMDAFVAHLDNEKEFKRPNRVPTLSADSEFYVAQGGYWKGSVWAPTNYMVLRGLSDNGYQQLAYEIACDYFKNVVEVFKHTHTLHENYAPETVAPGNESNSDFVGWTGLASISILFEYVFGIQPDAQNGCIHWHIHRTERHGIKNYPFGEANVDLICEARQSADEEPTVTVVSDKPVTVNVIWNGQTKTIRA